MDFLPNKDWNRILDKYLNKGIMSAEDYETLLPEQKQVINEIKKALKRINI